MNFAKSESVPPSVAVLLLLVSVSAYGQEELARANAADDSEFAMSEVVVTAQKRETSLQDTPLAISAFTGKALEQQGISDVSGLEAYVPSLHVGREQDGFKISIRGIGLQGTSAISDSGVAFYTDGFYIPRPTGGSAVFFDVERVEVLRGPQGTLYGRNATGGVVNVIANEPEDSFYGNVGVSYGERELFESRGVLNVPITDNIATRLSLVYTQDDGYTENLSGVPETGDLFGRDGDFTGRAQIRLKSADGTTVLLSLSHSNLDGSGVPLKYLKRNVGGPPPTQALLGTLPPDLPNPLAIETDSPAYNDIETTIVFARLVKEFSTFDLFIQGGYLEQESDLLQDTDGSPTPVSRFFKIQDNESSSLEARVSSTTDAGLEWIFGAYYFEEESYLNRRVTLNGLSPMGIFALPEFLLDEWGDASTAAAFGSMTFPLSDTVGLSTGLRHTSDDRGGTKITISNFGQPLPPDLNDISVSYDRTTWKLGLEWRPSEGAFVYGSISNGYKAGGFNLTSSGQPYDPEEVTAIEVGVKSNLLDGRAQLNLDAFHYDYDDLQLTNLTSVNNAPGQLTTNATASTVYGLELDGYYRVTPEVRMLAGYTFIDATFDEYFNTDPRDPNPVFNPDDPLGLGRRNLEGNRLPYVSEHTAKLGIEYSRETHGGNELTIVAQTNWHSDMYLREYNDPVVDKVGSNSRTDARISYRISDLGLTFTAYAMNIEDETEKTNIQVSPGFVGRSAVAAYSRPRTWGLRVDLSF